MKQKLATKYLLGLISKLLMVSIKLYLVNLNERNSVEDYFNVVEEINIR